MAQNKTGVPKATEAYGITVLFICLLQKAIII